MPEYTIRIILTVVILVLGYLLSRLVSRIYLKIRRREEGQINFKKDSMQSIIENFIFAAILVVGLLFLGFSSVTDFSFQFLSIFPSLLTFLLLITLGILIVQIVIALIEKFILYSRFMDLLTEDVSRNIVPIIFLLIRVILYITLIEVTVTFIKIPGLQQFAHFILYPILALLFLALFVALINPVRDYASSFYLRNIWTFKRGDKIRIDGKTHTIKQITPLSTELETEEGHYFILPNRIFAAKGIEFAKPSHAMQTLEDIKNRYVAQLPSMCGPACAQIVLSLFHITSDQKTLAKLSGFIQRKNKEQKVAGTHPESLIKGVAQFTSRKVIGAWIGSDKIYNFKQEVTTWLNEGALLIVDYKKRYLFPGALRAHYSVIVGVRRDELLVVDPSSKAGGVYFVDRGDVEIGMDTYSDLIKGKRGYIVLAPKDTLAYQRISDGLIYHHASMYDKISRALENKLYHLTNTSALIDMLPNIVSKHLKKFEKEQVSRVWKPSKK